jgi:hypothetical protein
MLNACERRDVESELEVGREGRGRRSAYRGGEGKGNGRGSRSMPVGWTRGRRRETGGGEGSGCRREKKGDREGSHLLDWNGAIYEEEKEHVKVLSQCRETGIDGSKQEGLLVRMGISLSFRVFTDSERERATGRRQRCSSSHTSGKEMHGP